MNSIKLKSGREKSLRRKHPWVFSGATENDSDIKQTRENLDVRY